MSPAIRNLLLASTALLALSPLPVPAQPTGGTVVGGSATIQSPGSSSVLINQTSQRAIINWRTFNIGSGQTTTFSQPNASAIALNRVTGGLGPSVIDGTLTANGRVFVINRDGMLFGRGAVINTAGFLASTNDIKNEDFMAGRMNFNIPGRPDASIVNLGRITATSGGFAALVAPGVRNSGTITARLGTVALASGNSFTLDMYGDRLIQLAIGDEIASQVIDVQTGKPLKSLVGNDGRISANGGRVELTAAAARHIVDSVINTSGVIEANSVGTRNGRIVLGAATASTKRAGLPTQTVSVSGKISAAGKRKGAKGGTIEITGEDIRLTQAALDASGFAGGGRILIGGDYGGGGLPTATTLTVDGASTLNASARSTGDGGRVILWSDVLTTFAGTIAARGGERSGDGGFVEVSGKRQLAFTGSVDTRAPYGRAGALLLDPDDFVVDAAAAATIVANLATTPVTIMTSAAGTGGVGDITVNAPVNWTSTNSFTLSAFRNIQINANISNSGGAAVILRADNTGTGTGTVNFASAQISTSGPVSIFYNPSVNPAGSAVNTTSYVSPTENFGPNVVGGTNNLISYMLVNTVNDLQNIKNNLGGTFALGKNIDASATSGWNGGDGFAPIGDTTTRFSGVFDGQRHQIDSLYLNTSGALAGLFGSTSGTVRNFGLGATVIGRSTGAVDVGGVAARNSGTISDVHVSGDVRTVQTNFQHVGGLVGVNSGTVSASSSTATVTAGTGNNNNGNYTFGGLAGSNQGSISGSFASGAVIGDRGAGGGLAGLNDGTIGNSYASGDVSSNAGPLGGFVGWNRGGTISNSYALGSVTNANDGAGGFVDLLDVGGQVSQSYSTGRVTAGVSAGGFIGSIGFGGGTVTSSYWDVGTSGRANAVGSGSSSGITGLATADARTQSNYVGFGFSVEGFWFMIDGQTRPFLRAEHSTTIRNTHQLQLIAMDPSASYTLANNIDFAGQFGAAGVWGATGFAPIGSAGSPFTGSLNGAGFNINALMIAPSNASLQSTGLFGTIGGSGAVMNLNLTNANVSANPGYSGGFHQWVGILAGQSGGTIDNVTATGTVSGLSLARVNAGGLVGQHGILGPGASAGTIANSSANVAVTVASGTACPGPCAFNAAGGLVGANVGGSSIANSFATGNISGGASTWAGGLVGENGFFVPAGAFGTIANSYATGNVTVSGNGSAAGGLVGQNSQGATITNSQAFGAVSATFNATTFNQNIGAGGLVGGNSGTITSTNTPGLSANCVAGASFSCATGNVSVGTGGSGGGLAGFNDGTITRSFATGNLTGADGISDEDGSTHLGGLAGSNHGTITNSFARTGAIGNINSTFVLAGGLVGDNSGTIMNSTASGNVATGSLGMAGGLVANTSPSHGDSGGGDGANNDGLISNSSASGTVTVGMLSFGGGLVGGGIGPITNSFATGAVSGGSLSMVGGFIGANGGAINHSHATGNVSTGMGFAGGFVGFNFGTIALSYSTGSVNSASLAFIGGFAGMNTGTINQAYTNAAVNGAAGSFAGGFVGLNAAVDIDFSTGNAPAPAAFGAISQSYALGPVTGGAGSVVGGFAALNLGSINQVYAAGLLQGGTVGGLIGANNLAAIIPDFQQGVTNIGLPPGTATSAFWDMQTTGQITSAGGVGMNSAVLAGGLPAGFDPAVWSHGSYPYLVNLGAQNTTPGPALLPPQGTIEPPAPTSPPLLPPPAQQLVADVLNIAVTQLAAANVDTPQMVQQLQQQQTQQQQQQPQTTGSTPPAGPQPTRLDVGANRFFFLPPLNETRLVANQVVIQIPSNVSPDTLNAVFAKHGLSVLATQSFGSGMTAYQLQFNNQSVQGLQALIRTLAAYQIIAAAQANYTYALTQPLSESFQGDPGQYVPEKLRLPEVHRTLRGTNIPIAVLDSEIDGAHPDLEGAIAERYDATGADDSPHAHGTGMAGAIVSKKKLLGVAPGARIFAIRAFNSRTASAESTTFHILKGLDWAVNNKVRIVNMSFAGPRDPSLERALKAAHDAGVILIAAAGNAGRNSPPLYPAADRHVIAVTATDVDDKLFSGANRGGHITISAPGVDILVPAPEGEYQMTTGTSVATAHISGVVALMLERNPALTPADVRRILTASAKRLGPNNEFGAGLVDPIKALDLAAPRSAAGPGATRRQ